LQEHKEPLYLQQVCMPKIATEVNLKSENWFNGYISVAMFLHCAKLCTGTENDKLFCRQNSLPTKSKMAAVYWLYLYCYGL